MISEFTAADLFNVVLQLNCEVLLLGEVVWFARPAPEGVVLLCKSNHDYLNGLTIQTVWSRECT